MKIKAILCLLFFGIFIGGAVANFDRLTAHVTHDHWVGFGAGSILGLILGVAAFYLCCLIDYLRTHG